MKPTANHANHAKEDFLIHIFRGLIPDRTDTQPLPAAGQSALWKYKGHYIQADQRVGQRSDIVSIPVVG
jgi:hypothetical protein